MDKRSWRGACPEDVFIKEFEEHGPAYIARKYNVDKANVFQRRRRIEKTYRRQIMAPAHLHDGRRGYLGVGTRVGVAHPSRHSLDVINGVVLVGSDAHIWPGPVSTAMRAFIKFVKDMKPKAVIMNGDAMDFPTISKHPPIGWEGRPTVQAEIETAQDQLGDIAKACPRGCQRIWTLGNHDGRFETVIATRAPELAKVAGVHLQDHFPLWQPCWSVFINDDVVIKHRFKGGIHATHNNTMWAGRTLITGHLHSLKVTPFTDYNGTRYGVDTGCLADTDGKQFVDYTEDSPKNWRAGFVVLTFKDGRLLWPEVVAVVDKDTVEFRGQLIRV